MEFFSKTHPTKALTNLIENVAARLNGEDAQCIWRLETFMGGGKTHALIALYHMAKQRSIPSKEFPAVKVPANSRIVSFVETNPDPAAMTMWGEIAYKLGPQAYKVMKTSDENRSTPGVEKLKQILGEQDFTPCSFLIDALQIFFPTLTKTLGPKWSQRTLPAEIRFSPNWKNRTRP